MTTPAPGEGTPEITAPTAEEAAAVAESRSMEELRALAEELHKSGQLGYDPTTIVKGTVTAFDFNGIPPTLSINIGGDTSTEISDIRLLNNYSPEVGHTVLIAKQGPSIVVLGHITDLGGQSIQSGAGGWRQVTLSNGTSPGGGLSYRRIMDHGSWKVQWRGTWNPPNNVDVMLTGANILEADGYRPASDRYMIAARDPGSGSISVQVVFEASGAVYILAPRIQTAATTVTGDIGLKQGNTGGATTSTTSNESSVHLHPIPGDNSGFNSSGHTHSLSHGHSMNHDHSFSGGSHTHQAAHPIQVHFNGIEYFL